MKKLVDKLTKEYPDLNFTLSDSFCWSPDRQTVYYAVYKNKNPKHSWTLLHETAHALLNHKTYQTDLELLKMETEAWEKAQALAKQYDITISFNYIEDCLDSYRDWLHLRSNCPQCNMRCLQKDSHHYQCHNCKHIWKVSGSRLCRPYRLSVTKQKVSTP